MQSDVVPSLLHVLAGGMVCPCCGAPSAATAGPLLTRLNPPPLQVMRMRRPAGFLQSALVVLLMHGVAFGAAEDGVSRVAVNSAGGRQARHTNAPLSSTWPYPGEELN
jgi:hypothetical protein